MNSEPQIVILKNDRNFLVINKPHGLLVVRGKNNADTLMDWAKEIIGDEAQPVHRLDRVTSGCCLIAKNRKAQQFFGAAFRSKSIAKRYWALVKGTTNFKNERIDARLLRKDNPNAKKFLATQIIDKSGQRALTQVTTLTNDGHYSLIEAVPLTGRMHQIRAHLAHVGFPIIGDLHYGNGEKFYKNAIALHAITLNFVSPTKENCHVFAPLSDEWEDFLKSKTKISTKTFLSAYNQPTRKSK